LRFGNIAPVKLDLEYELDGLPIKDKESPGRLSKIINQLENGKPVEVILNHNNKEMFAKLSVGPMADRLVLKDTYGQIIDLDGESRVKENLKRIKAAMALNGKQTYKPRKSLKPV
jgi:hypothetical protein